MYIILEKFRFFFLHDGSILISQNNVILGVFSMKQYRGETTCFGHNFFKKLELT